MSEKNVFNPLEPQPLLIVISGPSGVGKDTVINRMKERAMDFHFVVTATNRPPREKEVHGVDYFFLSSDEFAAMIEADELMEYAVVYNDYKGVPKAQVRQALESGSDVIMRVDVQGAARIRELAPDALLVFLTVQDEEEMITRLRERKSETPKELNLRIAAARQELKRMGEYDYVVVNRQGHLDEAVDTIAAIIKAEHHRVKHRKVRL